MSEMVLVLFLYCGQPVGVVVSIPQPEGSAKTMVGPVERDMREFFLDKALQIEKAGGEVHRIKVEQQAEVTCPVAA